MNTQFLVKNGIVYAKAERYILYSYRYSIAKGWHWKYERQCNSATADDWLDVFRKDEPEITFRLVRVPAR